MKQYNKPILEKELIEIEDICAQSGSDVNSIGNYIGKLTQDQSNDQ